MTIEIIHISSSYADEGRFLFWTWEEYRTGMTAGVVWEFLKWDINPGEYNPLWLWFYFQKWYRKKLKKDIMK